VEGLIKFFKEDILIDKIIPAIKEVLFLDADNDPTLPMSIEFDSDKLFSDYTGLASDGEGDSATSMKSSAKLDIIPIFRPKTITQSDGKTAKELQEYTQSEIGRTIRSAISFSAEHYSWNTNTGKMFDAGDIISVKSERLRIIKPTKFLINSVTLTSSASETRKATFELAIASSYENKLEAFWLT
jgi:prophage tail gpP-like protein